MKQLIVTIEDKKWLSPLRSARFAEMSLSELQKQNVAQESVDCASTDRRKTQFITQKQIMEYLEYNPETGVFTAAKTHGTLWRKGKIVGHKNKAGYITITLLGKLRKAHAAFYAHFFSLYNELRTAFCPGFIWNMKPYNIREVIIHPQSIGHLFRFL